MTTTQTDALMALADRYAFHIPGSQHSDEARAALLAALQEQAPNPWKEAVLDQLAFHATDAPINMPPADILKRIIEVSVTMATDPAITQQPVQAREGEAVAWSDDALNRAYSDGVAVYGIWNGKDPFYTHWAPVPKRMPSDA